MPRETVADQIAAETSDDTRDRLLGVLAGVITPATIARVPNQPKTPLKSFRIPEELYRAAQVKAEERGENLSEEIRKFLKRYVRRP